MGNPETPIMNRIMACLSKHGCFVLRTNSGVYYTPNGDRIRIGFPGLSDMVGCTEDGTFFAIEVKVPGKKPRENQKAFLDMVKKHGGLAGVATSPEEAIEIVSKQR